MNLPKILILCLLFGKIEKAESICQCIGGSTIYCNRARGTSEMIGILPRASTATDLIVQDIPTFNCSQSILSKMPNVRKAMVEDCSSCFCPIESISCNNPTKCPCVDCLCSCSIQKKTINSIDAPQPIDTNQPKDIKQPIDNNHPKDSNKPPQPNDIQSVDADEPNRSSYELTATDPSIYKRKVVLASGAIVVLCLTLLLIGLACYAGKKRGSSNHSESVMSNQSTNNQSTIEPAINDSSLIHFGNSDESVNGSLSIPLAISSTRVESDTMISNMTLETTV